ncbi:MULTISPECIES: hypothetical protein [unclassified Leucobacter]|uniref:hypothetical protein n=1 Tax=unclassified Leucobacter TaxID=2621730 RepID=UPI003019EF99
MVDRASKVQLVIILVVAVVLVGAFGFLLTWAISEVSDARLEAGLTNVATIGGIVSGLSLSGTAVLALSGRYTAKVVGKYGSVIRVILFGGFSVLVAASLLCAVSVLWVDQAWTRAVLGYTVPLMLLTLIATALLINSAFAWNEPQRPKTKPSPYADTTPSEPSMTH